MADIVIDPSEVIAPTAPTRKKFVWPGIWGILSFLWVGRVVAKDTMKKKDHAGWVRKLARTLSVPVMILMSGGALISLTRDATNIIVKAATSGVWNEEAIISVVLTIIMGGFVLLMDALLIVFALDIMDARSQNAPQSDYIMQLMMVLFIAVLESITFGVLLWTLENPNVNTDAGKFQAVLIILRAVGVPLVAIAASTIGDRVMTDKEMLHTFDTMASNALAACIALIEAEAKIENMPIILAFKRWISKMKNAATMSEEAKAAADKELFEHVQLLMPGALQTKLRAELTTLRSQLEAERVQMQAQLSQERSNLMREVVPLIMEILERGEWPEKILEAAPEFSRISPMQLMKAAGIKTGTATQRSAKPATNSETIEGILSDLGIKPAKKPTPTAKGIWVKGSSIEIISDGKVTGEDATDLAKRLGKIPGTDGKSYVDGRAYICAIKPLANHLAKFNQLHPAILAWLTAQKPDETEEELPENVRRIGVASGS